MTYQISEKALYYVQQFSGKNVPIKEEEVSKVIEAMETGAIVVLRCGVLKGSAISGILRDMEAEHGFIGKEDEQLPRKAFRTDLPEILKQTGILELE